jgi:hypothetical protein
MIFLIFPIASGESESSLAVSNDAGVFPQVGKTVSSSSGDAGVLPPVGKTVSSSSGDAGVLPPVEKAVSSSSGDAGVLPPVEKTVSSSSDDAGVLPQVGKSVRAPREEIEGPGIENGGFWEWLEHIYTKLETDIEHIIKALYATAVIK